MLESLYDSYASFNTKDLQKTIWIQILEDVYRANVFTDGINFCMNRYTELQIEKVCRAI